MSRGPAEAGLPGDVCEGHPADQIGPDFVRCDQNPKSDLPQIPTLEEKLQKASERRAEIGRLGQFLRVGRFTARTIDHCRGPLRRRPAGQPESGPADFRQTDTQAREQLEPELDDRNAA